MRLPSVSALTVTHDSEHVLGGLIADLSMQSADIDRTIIVDSGSEDPSYLDSLKNSAHVIKLNSNVGFGAACNAGARVIDSEFIFFINPDTRLPSDAIEKLLHAAEITNVDVLGPHLVGHDLAELPAPDRLPNPPWLSDHDARPHIGLARHENLEPRVLIPGSAMLMRTSLFHKVGGFDPRFFLFMEEVDLFKRLYDEGYTVGRLRDCDVIHASGRSSSSKTEPWRRMQHIIAHTLYGLKHFPASSIPLLIAHDMAQCLRVDASFTSLRDHARGVRAGIKRSRTRWPDSFFYTRN